MVSLFSYQVEILDLTAATRLLAEQDTKAKRKDTLLDHFRKVELLVLGLMILGRNEEKEVLQSIVEDKDKTEWPADLDLDFIRLASNPFK